MKLVVYEYIYRFTEKNCCLNFYAVESKKSLKKVLNFNFDGV